MSPRRTSFIAGNWKMYKTIAEAERYVQALLPKSACTPDSARSKTCREGSW